MALGANHLRRALQLKRAIEIREDAAQCEASLHTFLIRAWPHFDSSPFLDNWHLHAIAEHLMAVTNGQIKRLLINIPPRACKTNLVSIAWPVWTWTLEPHPNFPLRGAGVRFLCASYGASKAEVDGVTARRLIGSTWFSSRWGHRVKICTDRDNQSQYDTEMGGYRICTGIPESLGKGGAIRVLDDPHKTNEVESETQLENVLRGYREVWRTRSNDPINGAEVLVMQRLRENDVSGSILAERDPNVVHLMLPQEYESQRHCHTVIGFHDPRRAEGELLWPARFTHEWVERERKRQGEYAWAGQQQQSPTIRGGGIIRRDEWRVWPPEEQADSWYRTEETKDGRTIRRLQFPELSYVLLSVDTAFSEKDEADWSACVAFGVFEMHGMPKVIMLEAWRERLSLRPLVLKILDTAARRYADGVAIEAKASGISVIQEMRRLMRGEEFTLFPIVPKGDKVARLHAASPAFSAGIVFAPERQWAEMVIDEVAAVPRGKHDDQADCVSQAINHLRKMGLLRHVKEVEADSYDEMLFRGNQPTVREMYGL